MPPHLGSLLRTIFGPMPEFYCWWIIFCRNVLGNGVQLCLDCNIIFRVRILCNQTNVLQFHILFGNLRILNDTFYCFQYIYLLVLKNYAAVQEDFWSKFLNMSIFMYSCLTSYFYMVIPGKYAINYYICAGLNPNVDPYDEEKVVIFMLFEVLF